MDALSNEDYIRRLNCVQRIAFHEIVNNEVPTYMITGEAGNGKSFLVQTLWKVLNPHSLGYKTIAMRTTYVRGKKTTQVDSEEIPLALTAYTGVAAFEINGETLDSAMGFRWDDVPSYSGCGVPGYEHARNLDFQSDADRSALCARGIRNLHPKRKMFWKSLRRLVIDEISMVPTGQLIMLDTFLRKIRGQTTGGEPFGGVQVILCGDFCQLGAIQQQQQISRQKFILKNTPTGPLFEHEFFLKYFARSTLFLNISQRTCDDNCFRDILKKIRDGEIDGMVLHALKSRVVPNELTFVDSNQDNQTSRTAAGFWQVRGLPRDKQLIHIYGTNQEVERKNKLEFEKLCAQSHESVGEDTTPIMVSDIPVEIQKNPGKRTIYSYGLSFHFIPQQTDSARRQQQQQQQQDDDQQQEIHEEIISDQGPPHPVPPENSKGYLDLLRAVFSITRYPPPPATTSFAGQSGTSLQRQKCYYLANGQIDYARLQQIAQQTPPPPTINVQDDMAKACRAYTHDYKIQVAVGAIVMMIANVNVNEGLTNGAVGIVEGFSPETGFPIVRFRRVAEPVEITPFTWSREVFIDQMRGYTASMTGLPIVLSWGATVHKTQGATLDGIVVDMEKFGFTHSLAYVAFTRVRKLEDLFIVNFSERNIKQSAAAIAFYKKIEAQSTKHINALIPQMKTGLPVQRMRFDSSQTFGDDEDIKYTQDTKRRIVMDDFVASSKRPIFKIVYPDCDTTSTTTTTTLTTTTTTTNIIEIE